MLSPTQIDILRAVKGAIREPTAWPGGYPKYIVLADGDALSIDAARAHFSLIVWALFHGEASWSPAGVDINYEDPALYCCHTHNRIESAYAEHEA